MLLNYISVAIGGAIGAILRYYVLNNLNQENMPYGTITVNIIGSFIIGVAAAIVLILPEHALSENARLFIKTGLLGGFTTFSTFSLESMRLIQNGDNAPALMYISASVIGSLIAVFIGYNLMRAIVT